MPFSALTSFSRLVLLSLLLVGCGPLAEGGTGPETEGDETEEPLGCIAENGWPISNMPEDYEGTGSAISKYAYDFTASDQFGNVVELGQFYGKFVLLDFSAIWCPPCNQAAGTAQALHDELQEMSRNVEVQYIHVLIDDDNPYDPSGATARDAAGWAEDYGLSIPVLNGPRAQRAGEDWNVSALPTFYLLDPTFQVVDVEAGFPGDNALGAMVRRAWAGFSEANPTWENPFADCD